MQPFRCAPFRHIDDAVLVQLLCRPGNTPAMVTICCRNEGKFPQFVSYFLTDQPVIRQLRQGNAQFLSNVCANTKAATQAFEGIETKAFAFILYVNGLHAQCLGQMGQRNKRRSFITGKATMERLRFLRLFITKSGNILAVLWPG